MKENQMKEPGFSKKTHNNKQRSRPTNGSRTENVLKRHRTVDSESQKTNIANGQARYTAYHSHRSGGSPLAQHLSNTNVVSEPEVEKRLSPVPSKRFDECCSPPAKIPSSTQSTYAGAKFHDPPSPKALPKPPTSWVSSEISFDSKKSCSEMTSILKVMLKVQS